VEVESPVLPAKQNPETPTPKEPVDLSKITAVFNVAAKILAVRLFLFLSLIGSFVLSIIATFNGSLQSIGIVLLFACVTTLPLTILEWKNNGG
jgi:hypothetical protein